MANEYTIVINCVFIFIYYSQCYIFHKVVFSLKYIFQTIVWHPGWKPLVYTVY